MKAYLFMSLIKMLQMIFEYRGIVNPTYWCCCLRYHPMNKPNIIHLEFFTQLFIYFFYHFKS